MDEKLVKILRHVESPARYVGGEVNVYPINTQMRVRYCLCYPGLYEDGMNKREVTILYHLLNDKKGYNCERCFAPFFDMGAQLRKENYPLFSLETKTPLSEFDLLGFALTSELNYTTMLYMLELAGLPYESKYRREDYPLIYGYGDCTFNPEPLGDILDFMIIGDFEDATIKVIDTIMKAKLSNLKKPDVLKLLSDVEGVYVPSLVSVEYDKAGKISRLKGKVVKRQVIRDLDRAYFPRKMLVPNMKTNNDGAFIELMRGCDQGCRFCQEGYVYRPIRERRVQTLLNQATAQLVGSGVKKLRMWALEATSYSRMDNLIGFIDPLCKEKKARWMVDNLSHNSFNSELTSLEKFDTLSLTIEAGTQRLRNVINKTLSDLDINSTIKSALYNGYASFRLNFLIGLPFETAEDLVGIVDIAKMVKDLYKEYHRENKPLKIVVSTRTFVPRAFTPFEFCSFMGRAEILKRQTFIKAALDKLGVEYVCDNPSIAEIEAVFARGDRRLGKVLMVAYKRGAIFNDEKYFNAQAYSDAFSVTGVDSQMYLAKKDTKETLPWDLVDVGITKSFYLNELKKSFSGDTTPSCLHSCAKCGLHLTGGCKYGNS